MEIKFYERCYLYVLYLLPTVNCKLTTCFIMLIELEKITKIYNQGQVNEVTALEDIDLRVEDNSITCLRGASGSGKSTLLAIIGCVFQPTRGRVSIAGKQLSRLPDRFLTLHRRQYIGFIFQTFNILPALTVRANITLPLIPRGVSPTEIDRIVRASKKVYNLKRVRAGQKFDIYAFIEG